MTSAIWLYERLFELLGQKKQQEFITVIEGYAKSKNDFSWVNLFYGTNSYGNTLLQEACKNALPICVRSLLSHKADVNLWDHMKATPLFHAAKAQSKRCVELLVSAKADINWVDNEGRTALYRSGVAIAHYLVKSGAEVNTWDFNGATPLHHAAAHGFDQILQMLLQLGASLESQTYGGKTPLALAVTNNHSTCAKVLLNAKANPNTKDSSSQPLLHLAAKQSYGSVFVTLLLNYKANVSSVNLNGDTALHIVHHNDSAKELLKWDGCDVDAKNDYGMTPLDKMLICLKMELARILVSTKSKFKMKLRSTCVEILFTIFPRHLAVLIVDYSISLGADISLCGGRQNIPEHLWKQFGGL